MRRTNGFPIPLEEAAEAERVLSLIRAAAMRIRPGVPHDQQPIADLDVSIGDFIDNLQAPPVTRDLLYAWAARQGLDAASALWHLHAISRLGAVVAFAGLSAYKIASGTVSLVSAIIEDCAPEVRLSTPVVEIAQNDTSVTVRTADGDELVSSRAVIALPVNVLADIEFSPLLNEGKRALADERHAGQVLKIFALVENLPERVMAVGWGLGCMLTYWTEQILPDGNLLVGFGYPSAEFDPTSIADVQASLDMYFKGARVVAIDGNDWGADPYAKGTHMVPRPGQLTRLMSAQSVPEGRLHFAGADISTGWFSYMEGALETGRRAADELRACLAIEARNTPVL
jgi:monoamine oxidase